MSAHTISTIRSAKGGVFAVCACGALRHGSDRSDVARKVARHAEAEAYVSAPAVPLVVFGGAL